MSAPRGRPLVPMIVVPDEICGAAMSALTPAQRAFVIAKVQFGCTNAEAARRAGYSKEKPQNAKVSAYQLAHRDDIQAAIIEESRKVICTEGPRSILTLVEIRDDKSKDTKDRVKAAVEILNRGGLNAVSEHHLTVEHRLTDAQKDQRILSLCQELGIPETEARKMLISPDTIDAEFIEIETEKTPDQSERSERYARTNEREKRAARRQMSPDELASHKQQTRETHIAEMKARYTYAQQHHGDLPARSTGLEDILGPVPEETT